MRLVRERDGAVVADELELADSFVRRLFGLMGRRALPTGRGLWLEPCTSVHMMFVPFAIDVVFVRRRAEAPLGPGARAEVVEVAPRVRPWVGLAWCRSRSAGVQPGSGRGRASSPRAGPQEPWSRDRPTSGGEVRSRPTWVERWVSGAVEVQAGRASSLAVVPGDVLAVEGA